jgi:hypothetical protein
MTEGATTAHISEPGVDIGKGERGRGSRDRWMPEWLVRLADEKSAAVVFAVYVAVALPLLVWMGSYRWFLGDEWTFISDRSVALHDLFQSHNQHWVTLPLLVYRGLYSLFGLHSYWPYQLVVIVLHLTAAVLLRVIMRRAGVGPWLATLCAGTFVLLGAAEDNILWAFQIGFVGSLVLGLTQTLLADHDGPIDRRDWLGLGAGLLCLMTTGQAPALILAAGLVCVIRRRWSAAALHTVVPGVVYIAWFLLADVEPVVRVNDEPFTVGEYFTWMKDAFVGLFTGLGHFTFIAVALVCVLVAGAVVAVLHEGARHLLHRASIPASLLVAAVVSMSVAAPSRFALGEEQAKAGRYIGVMAALTLPALAVAADALVNRWRWSTPLVVAVFLVPMPFNAVDFGDDVVLTPASFTAVRNYVANLPHQPLVHEVPSWVKPNESLLGQPDMTLEWLLDADRRGELPEPSGPLSPLTMQLLPIQLGVAKVDGPRPTDLECVASTEPLAVDPTVGERWYFASPVQIAGRAGDAPGTLWVNFPRTNIEITLPDLHLLLAPPVGEDRFELCR